MEELVKLVGASKTKLIRDYFSDQSGEMQAEQGFDELM